MMGVSILCACSTKLAATVVILFAESMAGTYSPFNQRNCDGSSELLHRLTRSRTWRGAMVDLRATLVRRTRFGSKNLRRVSELRSICSAVQTAPGKGASDRLGYRQCEALYSEVIGWID